jgi:hypothetical protein
MGDLHMGTPYRVTYSDLLGMISVHLSLKTLQASLIWLSDRVGWINWHWAKHPPVERASDAYKHWWWWWFSVLGQITHLCDEPSRETRFNTCFACVPMSNLSPNLLPMSRLRPIGHVLCSQHKIGKKIYYNAKCIIEPILCYHHKIGKKIYYNAKCIAEPLLCYHHKSFEKFLIWTILPYRAKSVPTSLLEVVSCVL